MDGSDSQNADMMDFDDGSGPVDPRFEKQQQQLLHADFYNDFGDLFNNVKVWNLKFFTSSFCDEDVVFSTCKNTKLSFLKFCLFLCDAFNKLKVIL